MARFDEQELAVAGVYARALLELALEGGDPDEIEGELAALAGMVGEQPRLAAALSSPMVDEEARGAMLEKALRGGASDLVVDTLMVMNRKNRLGLVASLSEAYRLLNERRKGEIEVEVVSAVELSDALRERLAEVAGRFAGGRARLVERVDPDLLGGLVVRVGDRKVDTSLARQIQEARSALFDRASHELHQDKQYFD